MSNSTYNAVIFDMDGVLADSEPVYYAAMNSVLDQLGVAITPEQQLQLMGHGVEDTWRSVASFFSLEGPLDDLVRQYDDTLCHLLSELREPLPGVRELIAALQERGTPYALASSSWPGWIEALLGGIGLADAFEVKVSATMVDHPKPAPDLYMLAAERIGVDPSRCIAIEDTPTGLAAAKAAGMLCVQVRAASTAFGPLPDADIVLPTLESFDLTLLAVQ